MNEAGIKKVLGELGLYDAGKSYRQGNWFIHPCPFAPFKHDRGTDRNPSFGIAIVEDGYSYYKCFTCKSKGHFYRLPDSLERAAGNMRGDPSGMVAVMNAEQDCVKLMPLSPPTKMDYAQQNKPEPLNKNIFEGVFDFAWQHREAREYLKSRGIGRETAEKLGLLFDQDDLRIVFPVYDKEGNLYGHTGRTVLENWAQFNQPPMRRYPRIKNYHGLKKEWFLLGEHLISPESRKPIIVVEGLFGYAHLIEIGAEKYFHPVALMGSDMSTMQAQTLINFNRGVYLLFDSDEAGDIGTFGKDGAGGAVAMLYPYCTIYVPEWPENKVDPDQLTEQDLAIIQETEYYVI